MTSTGRRALAVEDLLQDLSLQGLRLWVEGDKLKIWADPDGPAKGVVPHDLAERLQGWKPALIAALKDPQVSPALTEAERDRTHRLLHNLALKGFDLYLDDHDSVAVDSDREVPPELLDRLKERKPALVSVLKAQARAAELLKARTDVAAETRTVCIECPWGRVWIVPERTGINRIEATWTELHEDPEGTLARCETLGNAVFLLEGKLLANGPPRPQFEPSAPSTHHPGGSR